LDLGLKKVFEIYWKDFPKIIESFINFLSFYLVAIKMIKIKEEENTLGSNLEIKNEIREFFNNKELLSLQEENKFLKASLFSMKAEMAKFKEIPLLVCDVKRVIDRKAVIKIPNGNCFYVNIANGVCAESGDSVLVEQKSLTIIKKLEKIKNFDVESFVIVEKPNVKWNYIGGLDEEINELKEVVELPLEKPALFKKIGIIPPKGVLLHGEPGTGKTLLAKAVATSCNATFIEIVASELVQKYIGDGAKLVRDIFQLARERKPAIVFIDEIDALAAKRLDIGTSGEREVQRTFMQLLSEIDGFNNLDNVKIVAATNRIDILDPALLRPGRFDRLIEVPLPEKEGRKQYTFKRNEFG
jgi:proteasome regulatory subunit